MTLLFWFLLVFFVGWALVRGAEAAFGPRPTPDETHFTTTSDGWRIALHRYRPAGDKPHGEPVLLHHGLSAAAESFDLGLGTPEAPVPCFPRWLAARGYDVWVCDLRGRGASDKPVRFGSWFGRRRWGWSMDDYIERDDPAMVDDILANSVYENLHWIGHSMGGILLYAHCALHGSPRLASGITIGSGMQYGRTGSRYQTLSPYGYLASRIPRMPLAVPSKIFSWLCGRFGTRLEQFQLWPSNAAPAVSRAVYAGVINDVSGPVLHSLSTVFEDGGLRSMDGKTRYVDLVKNITTPILCVGGSRDRQSPEALAEKTYAWLGGGSPHDIALFGTQHGHADEYGHFDLIVGLRAEQEVYPRLLDWLQKHPAKKKSAARPRKPRAKKASTK